MAQNNNNGNNGLGAAALLQQLGTELNREEDTVRNLWSQVEGLTGENHPSMDDFKRAYKVCKQKEMWVLGREYVTTPEKPRVEPAHLFCALGCRIEALGAQSLLTRQQRDDAIAKYMSASNAMSKPDAIQTVGEVLLDTQILSIEQAATNYHQRFTAWWDADFESKWRDNYRRQERMYRDRVELRKVQEEQEKKMKQELEALRAAAHPYGGGESIKVLDKVYPEIVKAFKKAKCRFYDPSFDMLGLAGRCDVKCCKKGEKPVCHHYLQGKCSRGNCKFRHPEKEADFTKSEFDVICTSFPFLSSLTYGSWWKKAEEPKTE
eukprot:g3001.t1